MTTIPLRSLLACTLVGLFFTPAALAAPQEGYVGEWSVEGKDPGGSYRGTVSITPLRGTRLKLDAKLAYADGRDRSWSSRGRYMNGRVLVRYTISTPSGIAGHLNGSTSTVSHLSATYVLIPAEARMRVHVYGPGFMKEEVLRPHKGCPLNGTWVVGAAWGDFSEWRFELKDDRVVDSRTDVREAKDWPTRLERDGDRVRLSHTRSEGGTIRTEVLVLRVVRCRTDGGADLRVDKALSTVIDADGDPHSRTLTNLTLRMLSRPATSSPEPQGKFVIRGSWPGFRAWTIELQDGRLGDSHTDVHPASAWKSTLERDGDHLRVSHTTRVNDQIHMEHVILKVVRGPNGRADLKPVAAHSTRVDTSGGADSHETRTQEDLSVVQPDGRVVR